VIILIVLQCSCQELASLLSAFGTITSAFPEHTEEFHSKLLNDIFSSLPKLKAPIKALLAAIDIKKANSGRKDELWTDPEQFPALDEYKLVCMSLNFSVMLLIPRFEANRNCQVGT
jgi:DNA mismatch repair protein MSH3